ncbi:MAG: SpvB/TcaC N-terminal domain-containing protein [Hyphomicrobiaceae bacterium]|nr:SpvB/TcaC N-terminal domain-containing protein [Hyphomicrobiaceae bacterium]
MRMFKPLLAVCVLATAVAALAPWPAMQVEAQTQPPASAPPPESAPPPDSISLPPAGSTVVPDASLPEPVKMLERDTLQYLTDGNTHTAYTAYAQSTIRLTLNTGREVKGIKVFGASPYRLSVKSLRDGQVTSVAGLESVDLSTLRPGWNHIASAQPLLANQLELTITPLQQGGSAGIAELELWGKGAHINATAENVTVATPPPQTVVVKPVGPAPDQEFILGAGEGAAASARFNFTSPLAPNQVNKAFLVYEINGLSHWSEAARSINGAPANGGHVRREATQWTVQSEPLAPDLIAAGANVIEFRAVGDGSVPYQVRNVRLVFDPGTGWNFIDHVASNQGSADALLDGDAASGWQVYPSNTGVRAAEPTLVAELRQAVAIDRVRVNLTEPLSGNLAIEVRTGTEWQVAQASVSASTLVPGFNDIALAARPTGTAVRLRFTGGDGPAKVAELQVAGSPAGSPDANPALTLSYPDAGQYFGDIAYVRGFLRPRANASGEARILVAGKPANVDRGAFEISIAKSEMGLDQDGAWSVNVDAVYPDGKVVTRTARFDQLVDALRNDSATAVTLTTDVAANAPKIIDIAEAQLDIVADALPQTTRILAQTIEQVDLPRLDAGMSNLTKGARTGYRFLPHGTKFKKKLKIKLPYDKAKLPVGITEDQIRTFFFDTDRGAWVALERVEINTAKGEIVSLTDHFTDFINGVVAVPDHPETSSLNPTQFKDMKAANPGAKINVIAPPEANASGDVRLSYPLELPPGRTGHAPSLGLSYSSSGENGWVGLGWDLSVSAIQAETRWGVPRYDTTNETETYNLDSEQLTPVAHRGPLVPRVTNRQFFARSESQFRRIIRHGDHPNAYWWEVREKDGTAFFYGGLPEGGLDPAATLRDAAGNVFKWALKEVRDTNANTIRYTYATVADAGMAGGTLPGTALYPQGIEYTGHNGAPGAYTVTFIRDRELPGYQRRKDVTIDGRGGFKMVTADLLRRIEIKFGAEHVRAYELTYREGAFHKTLLDKIQQLDSAGQPFNEHLLTYYDDARETDGSYKGFAGTTTWNTGNDNVQGDALIGGGLNASALSGLEGSSAGGHLYVGIAFGEPSKKSSVGAKVGTNSGDNEGLLALVDLDGDGLQDKVFRRGNGISYRPNRAGPNGTTTFGGAASVNTLPNISVENHSMSSFGPEVYLGVFFVGANSSSTDTESPIYFRDVNGDGLVDLVRNGGVLFNRVVAGVPTFDPDSSGTPYPIGDASVTAGLLTAEMQAMAARQDAANPKIDTLRRWVAPYAGTVAITAPVALLEDTSPQRDGYLTADGVRVAIQVNATELWSETIAPADYVAKTPAGLGSVAVQKGDVIYFRVQSVDDGAYDRVSWAPQIVYQGGAVADPNGLDALSFNAASDFTLNSLSGASIRMPFNGTVQVTGTLQKLAPTTDTVTVQLLKNGTVIAAPTLAASATGDISLNESVAVLKDEYDANQNQTQTGDTLEVRIVVDSRVDMAQIKWAQAAPPRIAYTASTEINPITDPQTGGPSVAIDVPAGADLYSESDLTQPLTPFVVSTPGTYVFQADVTAGTSGPIIVTAKSPGALLAKQTIAGSGSATLTVTTTAASQPVYFEFHTRNPSVAASVTQHTVRQVAGGVPAAPDLPSALHSNSVASILPQAYRGWVAFGYKGNGPAANQPVIITGADLTLSGLAGLDPDAYRAAVEQIIANGGDPTSLSQQFDLKVVPYYPNHALQRVDGPDPELWASAADMQASRRGKNYIANGSVDRFAGARAVPLLSTSDEFAVAGSLTIGAFSGNGSKSDTVGRALLDFKDLNGDQFPDVVSNGLAVQFSPAVGGLETETQGVGAAGAAQQTTGSAFTFGIGGNFSHQTPNASSGIDTRFGLSRSGDTSQQMASIGFTFNQSQGESDVDYDLYDMNGDGLPDRVSKGAPMTVQLNVGYGFLPAEPWSTGDVNHGESNAKSVGGSIGFNDGIYGFGGGINQSDHISEGIRSLQDINGDGLVDRVLQDGGRLLAVGLNTGNGFFADVPWPSGLGNDFARQKQETQGGGAYFTISIPIGPSTYIIINPGADYSRTLGRGEASIADIDGDGYPDHLKSTNDASITASGNTHGRTNMLRSVQRPLMASFEVDYVRTGNTYLQPQNRWALAKLIVNDGQPGDGEDRQLKTYAWEGGFFERRERQFFGFAKCVETQHDPANPSVAYRVVERLYNNTTFYNKMLLARETLSNGTGNPFTQVEHTYVVRDEANQLPLVNPSDLTARAFAQLTRTDKRWFEGQATAGKATFETFAYDTYGNVAQYLDTSEAGPADDVTADITYHQDLPAYIVGKAATIRVSGNGVLMRERQATFQPGTGNLLQVRRLLAGGTAAVTDMTYDAFGNLATLTGPANHAGQRYGLTYSYEPIANTHVASVTDSFGYVSSAAYDLKWGAQTQSTDINAKVITTTYDSVGRPLTVTGPYQQGTSFATISMEYHPYANAQLTFDPAFKPWAKTRHLDQDRNVNDFIETVTFIDGLTRVTQTKKDLALHAGGTAGNVTSDVMVVSGRAKYDGFGRVIEQSYPVTEAIGSGPVFNPAYDGVTPTKTTYDILDRPLTVANPANEVTSFVYNFGPDRAGQQQFRTRVTDAKAIPRELFRDVDDDITSVKLLNNGGGQTLWTSYGYDPLDQIVEVKDAKNNLTKAKYDNFGRRIEIDSPDAGRTEFVFDLAGNLHQKITANLRAASQRITYNYDFNRIATAVYPQFPANNATYTYGAPGAPFNRAGRAWQIQAESGVRQRDFGPLGEIVKEVRTVDSFTGPDPTYTTLYRYDTWNRLQSLTYPDGEVLDYDYDSGGLVTKISGAKSNDQYAYLNFLGYDKFEARTRMALGNGTVNTYAYNPQHRRLNDLKAATATNRTFMDMDYGYDPVGNILSLANVAPMPPSPSISGGQTAYTFGYDDLHQLTASAGTYTTLPNKTEKFTLSLAYDEIHNITSKDQLAGSLKNNNTIQPDKKITYDWDYDYGSTKPHAATHIGDRTFLYDLNGNQAGWDSDKSGQKRRITWDEENRIQTITDGPTSEYKYDEDTNRVIKRRPGGETFYINQFYVDAAGRNSKHVFAGTTRITTKLEMPSPGGGGFEKFQYFYHPDHLGSTSYVTDQLGQVDQHYETFPFGESWIEEATGQADKVTPYRFTGKEWDSETQLYYFGARYYDPRTSLWTAMDPALGEYLNARKSKNITPSLTTSWKANVDGTGMGGMFEPRNLNLAAYVHQNPLKLIDPDGRATFHPEHPARRMRGGSQFPAAHWKTEAGDTPASISKQTGIPLSRVRLPKGSYGGNGAIVTTPAADSILPEGLLIERSNPSGFYVEATGKVATPAGGGLLATGSFYDFESGKWHDYETTGFSVGGDASSGWSMGYFTDGYDSFKGRALDVEGSAFGGDLGIAFTKNAEGKWEFGFHAGVSAGFTVGGSFTGTQTKDAD